VRNIAQKNLDELNEETQKLWYLLQKAQQLGLDKVFCVQRSKEILTIIPRTFDVLGPEDGQAIIILHPSLATRKFHLYQARHWSQRYRVYCLDLPGHGTRMNDKLDTVSGAFQTRQNNWPVKKKQAIQAVSRFIYEHVPQKKALIFGWSLGGFIAMQLGKYNPGRMSRFCFWSLTNPKKSCVQALLSVDVYMRPLAEQPSSFLDWRKLYTNHSQVSTLPNKNNLTCVLVFVEKVLWGLIPNSYPHIPK
jgi:pimeloyl-ACP methyl ester carboxylesterase